LFNSSSTPSHTRCHHPSDAQSICFRHSGPFPILHTPQADSKNWTFLTRFAFGIDGDWSFKLSAAGMYDFMSKGNNSAPLPKDDIHRTITKFSDGGSKIKNPYVLSLLLVFKDLMMPQLRLLFGG
jgi:hypothetical protein